MGDRQFCIRWTHHQDSIMSLFREHLNSEQLCDVTLSCEGGKLKAHRIVLSACSTFFREIFADNPCQHPVIILKDCSYSELQALVRFMYDGEVNVTLEELPSLLKMADTLRIKGLTEDAEAVTQLGNKISQKNEVQNLKRRKRSHPVHIIPPKEEPLTNSTAERSEIKTEDSNYDDDSDSESTVREQIVWFISLRALSSWAVDGLHAFIIHETIKEN